MTGIEVYSLLKGRKEILIEVADNGPSFAVCMCEGFFRASGGEKPHVPLFIPLTKEQATELVSDSRRLVQSILPELHHSVREVFISGTTPAEWDLMMTGELRSDDFYRSVGYKLA